MPPASHSATFSRLLASLAVALTLLAGYVDAIGYLSRGHVYMANMSGNSIAIGIHSARAQIWQVWRFGWPVISFTVGLLASRLIVEWGLTAGWRAVVAPAIAIEAVALVGFAAIPAGAGGVFLAACAMGIQAATLSRFNGVTVYTGFVTGSLVKFAENAAELLIGTARRDRVRAGKGRRAAWFGSIWVAYVAGAILGTTALEQIARLSIVVAIGCLMVLVAVDLISPAKLDRAGE
jgi:uncharacterized membrane protein YoaK (UPF0700 family)